MNDLTYIPSNEESAEEVEACVAGLRQLLSNHRGLLVAHALNGIRIRDSIREIEEQIALAEEQVWRMKMRARLNPYELPRIDEPTSIEIVESVN